MPVPPLTDALRHAVHLAVVDGPGTGGALGVAAVGLRIGREEAAPAADPADAERPRLTDPLLSRAHFHVTPVDGAPGTVRVRDLGSTNGTRVRTPRRPDAEGLPRWRRAHRVGRTGRTVPRGSLVLAGATTFEVRARPGTDDVFEAAAPAAAPEPRGGARHRILDAALRIVPSLAMAGMMIPFLAARDGSPWRWLLLAVPVLVLGAGVAGLLHSAERRRPRPLDPAALALDLARARRGTDVPPALPWHLPGRPAARLQPGDVLGVCGPQAGAAAVWLAARAAAACPADRVTVCGVRTLLDAGGPLGAPPPSHRAAATGVGGPGGGAGRSWRILLLAASPGWDTTRPDVAAHEDATVRIVVARHHRHLPPWCTAVVETTAHTPGLPGAQWGEAVFPERGPRDARAVDGGAEAAVALPDLLEADLRAGLAAGGGRAAGAVRRTWRRGSLRGPGPSDRGTQEAREAGDLGVVLGTGPSGPCRVDLIGDGPHALVAGTTGSGKSEALVTWVLQLALTHDPRELQLLLLDHKGGATFGPLAGLPHVAGLLTDLDAASTDRALRSLTAEVTRREGLLAGAGARDLRDLERAGLPAPPRLVVVADEFRVLADAHPEAMDGLRRLAAQGRTLGIHLVLATQRPAGVLSADLRANVPLRLCLRVVEAADSSDVLGVADAARLPPVPGLAYLQAGALVPLRVAWSGEGATAAAVVAACRSAWARLVEDGARAPRRPWAHPLPARVTVAELETPQTALPPSERPPSAGVGGAGPLVLGLADRPEEQRLEVCRVRLDSGLLVVGDRGAGRTTVVRTLVAAAAHAGWSTHVLTADPVDDDALPPAGVRRGTWLCAHDAARARTLVTEILTGRSPAPGLVAVDDAEAVIDLLDVGATPGTGLALMERLVRDGPRVGVTVLAAGSPALAVPRWAAPLGARLVLPVRDETQTGVLGVPATLRGASTVPGRGVLLTRGASRVVQVAHTPPHPAGRGLPGPEALPALARATPGAPAGGPEPLDLRPLPGTVPAAGHAAAARHTPAPAACPGCDGAGPVLAPLDVARPWVVTGTAGSGRSTVLVALEGWCRAQGRSVEHLAGPDLLDHTRDPGLPDADVLLVDDTDAGSLARLEDLLRVPGARVPALVLVVPDHLVGAHATGLVGRARSSGVVVTTDPRASARTDVRGAADPHHPRHVVLEHRGRCRRVVVPG